MEVISLDSERTRILTELRASVPDLVLYDLGCGIVPFEDFLGIDALAEHPRVKTVDLYTYPWPMADESVDYYRSSHFLEHVVDWDAHWTEVYRTLKPGGYYEVIAPFYRSDRWFGDPDHKQPILHRRFIYLDHAWRVANNIAHYGAVVNFSVEQYFEMLHPDYRDSGMDQDAIDWAREHNWNVIDDIALIVKKQPLEVSDAQ